jgi:glucose/mannose-6-phosphate isomerase
VEAAAAFAEQLAAEWGPEGDEDGKAKALARRLHGTVPVIAGAEVAAAVAYRWKCQVNENAGLPAFASAIPELGHNEVVGWPAARELGRFSAVFLDDPGANPRNALRTEVIAAQAADWTDVVERVAPRGESEMEWMVSLVLLGDLVSLYLAVLRGEDPVAIGPIDALKAALAER